MTATIPPAELPTDVAEVRQRFDEWRRARTGRAVIPDDLWAAAVELAAKYKVHPTAKMLQVDYKCLKRRVEDAAMLDGLGKAPDAPLTFVELRPAASSASFGGRLAEAVLDLDQLVYSIAKEES